MFFKRLSRVGVSAVFAACGARTALYDPLPDATSVREAGADVREESVGCVPGDIPLTAASPEVMFVLDRSGSMRTAFEGSESRWEVLTDALETTLPPVDSVMEVGALLFPSGSAADDCSVATQPSLAPAFGNVQALVDLMKQNQPGGSTPTASAIDTTATYLLGVRAASSARAIVLATDGAPNCNPSLDPNTCDCASENENCKTHPLQCLDNVRTVDQIGAVYAHGIPTYVIGIANADDNQFATILDAMATAGGRPLTGGDTTFYPARDEEDLKTAIATIRNQVAACTFLTTSVPNASGSIVLTLNGQPLPYATDGGSTGWSWSDESNGEITLVGATCAEVAADAAANALVAHVECGDAQ